MTPRRKLIVCAGILALTAGVALVCIHAAKPQVELRFVRYASDGTAVLELTNRGHSTVACASADAKVAFRGEQIVSFLPDFDLMPRSVTRLVAVPISSYTQASSPTNLPPKVSVQCYPQPSELGRRIQAFFLRNMGINTRDTGFVATVQLPRR